MRARTCAVGRGIVWPCLVISRAVRMARLREAQEHPDWKWEGERRRAIRDRVEATRPGPPRRSVVPVTAELRRNLDQICVTELTATIKLHPPRSLSTARIWSIPCSNWFNAPKHWTTITKLCSGSSNRRPLGGLSAPKWLWLPSTRRRRNRMKSIRNSISNACWALSQLPSC